MLPHPGPTRQKSGLSRLVLALVVLALASLGLSATAGAAGSSQKPGELTFLLQLRHPRGLAKFVRSVSDPRSPQYRDYLTVEQIVRKFGARPAARKATMRWLVEHGAHAHLGATGTYVTARIPAGVAARALPAAGATGSAAGSVADARRVPAALRGAVTGVAAIGTKEGVFGPAVATQAGKHLGQEPGLKGTSIVFNSGTTAGCSGARTAGEADGLNAFTPNEYLTAFGHADLHKQGFKGQGKNIAVIETDGFRRSDIETFAKCFGLPTPNLRVRPVGIAKPLAPGNETTLDLEVLTATVPKAEHIYVYEGGGSEKQLLETVATALGSKGHHPDAISISLGQCEAELGGQIAFHETLNEVFAVADAAGISVLVAAGDTGSSGCRIETEKGTSALALVSASEPATSPFVTAVGGTNVELTKANRIKQEMVWNDSPIAFGAGSGGLSILTTPRPWWQRGLISRYGNGRIVPDVAGLADLVPGYAIYCTATECRSPDQPEGGWQAVGGTSAATPLYAGGVLLADGYEARHGAPPLGFLNPLVYEVGRENKAGKGPGDVLLDVTRGNDDLGAMTPAEAGGGAPFGCCSAAVGYDPASGWGSIDVPGLAAVAVERFKK
ncbi:MAG TPA: S53 family peptidase [Solirubrobacterales bacterium]|nr:S53 family peptidase [Solirubrobacterales bacterium]